MTEVTPNEKTIKFGEEEPLSIRTLDIGEIPARIMERSRLIPLTNASSLNDHNLNSTILTTLKDPPIIRIDYIRFKSARARNHPQGHLRIVGVTETTRLAFKSLQKSELYTFDSAQFFPAINLSLSAGFYEVVFLGIPIVASVIKNTWQQKNVDARTQLIRSLNGVATEAEKNPGDWMCLMVEPCKLDGRGTIGFESPQERLDKVSPVPAEKYQPPEELAKKFLKAFPKRHESTKELADMVKNYMLFSETIDDAAWLRMVTTSVI